MKIRKLEKYVGFFLLLLVLVAAGLVDDLWLSQLPVRNSDVFPAWMVNLDSAVFILINQSLSSPPLDLIMSLITHVGSTVFWLTVSLVLWFRNKRREAVLLATTIILGGIFFSFLKVFIARPRPYQVIAGSRVVEMEGGSSFPSGHTKNVFSAAVILGKNRTIRWKVTLYMLALIISFSRIYVGMHYPLDVLVGALAGYIIARIVLSYDRQIISLATRFNILHPRQT